MCTQPNRSFLFGLGQGQFRVRLGLGPTLTVNRRTLIELANGLGKTIREKVRIIRLIIIFWVEKNLSQIELQNAA